MILFGLAEDVDLVQTRCGIESKWDSTRNFTINPNKTTLTINSLVPGEVDVRYLSMNHDKMFTAHTLYKIKIVGKENVVVYQLTCSNFILLIKSLVL